MTTIAYYKSPHMRACIKEKKKNKHGRIGTRRWVRRFYYVNSKCKEGCEFCNGE